MEHAGPSQGRSKPGSLRRGCLSTLTAEPHEVLPVETYSCLFGLQARGPFHFYLGPRARPWYPSFVFQCLSGRLPPFRPPSSVSCGPLWFFSHLLSRHVPSVLTPLLPSRQRKYPLPITPLKPRVSLERIGRSGLPSFRNFFHCTRYKAGPRCLLQCCAPGPPVKELMANFIFHLQPWPILSFASLLGVQTLGLDPFAQPVSGFAPPPPAIRCRNLVC